MLPVFLDVLKFSLLAILSLGWLWLAVEILNRLL